MPKKSPKVEATSRKPRKSARKTQFYSRKYIQLLIAVSISIIGFFIATKFNKNGGLQQEQLKFWLISNENANLHTIRRVFERLNIKESSNQSDWDIVWSIEGPGDSPYDKIEKFDWFHKFNHFPGNFELVSKVYMNYKNYDQDFILPCFQMKFEKKEIEEYIQMNPNAKFVAKNFHNRGVSIVDAKDMNDDDPEEFYQVFLDNPLLIDGHAFDLGVFVLITSVSPLRVYKFDQEILLRFCKKPYHPFNPKDTDQYVVQEGHKSMYEMKAFGDDYRKYGTPIKELFDRYLRHREYNVTKLWEDIDSAIATVVRNSEQRIEETINIKGRSPYHFFELVRFDFILDENLNVYVMEVNMSPNVTSDREESEENSILYEPLIYSAIQMIGGGNYSEFMSRFSDATDIISQNNLSADAENCISKNCSNHCKKEECELCQFCLGLDDQYLIREAYIEWKYQGKFKRLFPRAIHFENNKTLQESDEFNKFMIHWYHFMCKKDELWC